MKQINVYFDDEEHRKLERLKDKLSWHDFIMKLLELKEQNAHTRN